MTLSRRRRQPASIHNIVLTGLLFPPSDRQVERRDTLSSPNGRALHTSRPETPTAPSAPRFPVGSSPHRRDLPAAKPPAKLVVRTLLRSPVPFFSLCLQCKHRLREKANFPAFDPS